MKSISTPLAERRPPRQIVVLYESKIGKRAAQRLEQKTRIIEAPTLAEQFPSLRSLKVRLQFLNHSAAESRNELKYSVNLLHAKSIFTFRCQNPECIGGDFDLSRELAAAVNGGRRKAAGEMQCQGWRARDTINATHCSKVLRFELSLAFK
jgi:hypothetical protein